VPPLSADRLGRRLASVLWVIPCRRIHRAFSDRRAVLLVAVSALAFPAVLDGIDTWRMQLPLATAARPPFWLPALLLGMVAAPSVTIATVSLAGIAERWPWAEWGRRTLLAVVYGFLYFGIFLIGGIGVIVPLMMS